MQGTQKAQPVYAYENNWKRMKEEERKDICLMKTIQKICKRRWETEKHERILREICNENNRKRGWEGDMYVSVICNENDQKVW